MSKKRRAERRKAKLDKLGKLGKLDGVSNKNMQKALNKIQTDTIDNVIEVIVRTKNEDIILENPEVTIMNVGQEIWNIIPNNVSKINRNISETKSNENSIKINDDDIRIVMSTANVDKQSAINALKKSNGDIAAAIMLLK